VISLGLALALRNAGVAWRPSKGDRFAIPGRDMDDDWFVLSDMTIEPHEFPGGTVLGFNGTVEWALDSLEQSAAVWLPAEDQLRALLGGAFVRLDRADDGFAVTVRVAERVHEITGPHPAEAYGRALLLLAAGSMDPRPSADPSPSALPGATAPS